MVKPKADGPQVISSGFFHCVDSDISKFLSKDTGIDHSYLHNQLYLFRNCCGQSRGDRFNNLNGTVLNLDEVQLVIYLFFLPVNMGSTSLLN